MVRGEARSEELAERAGTMASRGADPLDFNHFKIPLVENLVKRALRG
jgi:xanthine dehydrogenase YagS FAD-binding subunit